MSFFFRGSVFASFFILISFANASTLDVNSIVAEAQNKNLASHPVWSALIQQSETGLRIDDPDFILSHDAFSSVRELELTIRALVARQDYRCRFPARRLFVKQNMALPEGSLPIDKCGEYQEYLSFVPAEKVTLVYTSENLSQASSMMGHIMLKVSGTNDEQLPVEHGITFFTELNSVNAAKILWDSLFVGKKGFFKVSPYQNQLQHYTKKEQRNVWEYTLDLTEDQRALMQAYFWEMKNVSIPYFFHTYNCATLTQMILALAGKTPIPSSKDWVTPIDVVKTAHHSGLLGETRVIPSSKWKLRMLQDASQSVELPPIQASDLSSAESLTLPADAKAKFLYLELLETYNHFLYEDGQISRNTWLQSRSSIDSLQAKSELSDWQIDVSSYKSPLEAPLDSQMSVGVFRESERNWLIYSYMPASHGIEDDNRQFFGETELELSSLSILLDPENLNLKLNHWNLYSMRTHIPYERLTGGLSGRLRIGLQRHRNDALERKLAADVLGGVAFSLDVTKDINIYAQLNAGVGYGEGSGFLYSEPQVGVFINQVFDMKTHLSFSIKENAIGTDLTLKAFNLKHSIYINKNINVNATFSKEWNNLSQDKTFGLEVKYLY